MNKIISTRKLLLFSAFAISVFFLSQITYAQEGANLHPGKVSPEDFALSSPLIGATTDAVIIADIGRTSVERSNDGWRISFTRTKRVKILSNAALSLGSLSISFSGEDNHDGRLKDLRAYTYNLKNGQVETEKLNEKDIFLIREKNSDRLEERFAFPGVQVGSIIEYSYTIRSSDILSLFPWEFQGNYPTLWSEYAVVIPDLFNYAITINGKLPLYKISIDSVVKEISFRTGNMDRTVYTKKWIMREVPPLKKEPFIYCPEQYIAGIHFQLSAVPLNGVSNIGILRSWETLAYRMLNSESFGRPISDDLSWLGKLPDTLISGCHTNTDKAKRIFSFVRDNLACTGNGVHLHDALQHIMVRKEGTVAEINLLLIAMLRKAGIIADPVVLSTRENGPTNVAYPLLDNLNYVIARLDIDGRVIYLDASRKKMGFGKLPAGCYNGHARVIRRGCIPIFLQPDSLQESKMTTIFISNDEKEGQTARCVYNAGYNESVDIRNKLSLSVKEEDYFKAFVASLTFPAVLQNYSIDSLNQFEQPVALHYALKLNQPVDSIIYFSPLMGRNINPYVFVSGPRLYPVELPYASYETFVLDMEIPKGYTIEELPASAKIELDDANGSFEYLIGKVDDHIQLKCKLIIKKTTFSPDVYDDLCNFFGSVQKKEKEMIVFKKL
jgi:hypothetical protein